MVAWPPTTVAWPFSDFFQNFPKLLETSKKLCLTVSRRSRDLRPFSRDGSFSSIMGLDRAAEIPIATSPSAQELLDYFVKKIELIRKSTGDSPPTSVLPTPVETFSTFRTYSIDEVQKIINSKPIKSCSQDPIPANIFRQFLSELLPFITGMCNKSLQEGWLPVSQRHAIVRPIVKKDGLDPGDTKNYRPISNLTFLSKLIERMVCQQLTAYLEKQDLLPRSQSGFRGNHSTETALLKVLSDILMAADIGMVTLLGLLDMSAAFDTVDHDILICRLETSFGIMGTALAWLRSFLTKRTQQVVFNGHSSSKVTVTSGVPQGSVLGPLFFLLYTADIPLIASEHRIEAYFYADDGQLYLFGRAGEAESMISRVTECIADIDTWMSSNRMKLNSDKTQFIWLGTRYQRQKVDITSIQLGISEV